MYLKTSLDMQIDKSDWGCDRHTFLFQGLFYFPFFKKKKQTYKAIQMIIYTWFRPSLHT